MKTILQVVKGIDIGGHNGGAEIFGVRLSRELARKGENVTLCAFFQYNTACETDWERALMEDGVQVIYACKPGKIWMIEAFQSLKVFLSCKKVDIVHSHYQIGTIYAILFKILRKARFVVRTAHTPVEFGEGVASRLIRLLISSILYPFMVDQEIGVSQEIVNLLDRRLLSKAKKRNALKIYNALPTSKEVFNQDSSNSFSVASQGDVWVIATIGILRPLKNIDVLIRAAPIVLAKLPNCIFLVVGDGPDKDKLMSIAKQINVEEQIKFLGQRTDISTILENTDLYVHTSRIDGISTVILEAIQQNVPVIASDIPSHRELIENQKSGWLYPLQKPDKLAPLIIEALEHPEMRTEFAKVASSQLRRFTLTSVTIAHQELYDWMLSAKATL